MTDQQVVPIAAMQRRMGPVALTAATYPDAIAAALALIAARCGIVAFCNAHSVNLARADPAFAQAMAQALVFNDGIGVDLGSRLLHGTPFPANLNGTDFTPALLAASEQPLALYLLGSPPGVAEQAAAALEAHFPRHRVVGFRDGYFQAKDDAAVAAAVAATRPDLVLVGMGQPRQERWAVAHAAQLGATVLCIGAYLDFASGRIARAPDWVRRVRFEWAYRLLIEPRRLWSRYVLGNGRFLIDVLRERAAARR